MTQSQTLKQDKAFKVLLFSGGALIVVVLLAFALTLLVYAALTFKTLGLSFLTSSEWNPMTEQFGALPFLIGTLLTSFVALLLSLPFTLSISILLGEYFKSGLFSTLMRSAVELLAGIPSIIYGFWGLFVLVPIMREIQTILNITPFGVGIMTAAVVLAVMIIPYSAAISRDVISLVPTDLKEAAYGLGATRFEVIRKVILPYARSGIFAGVLMSLGRAVGETMAVTMVIGNANVIPHSLFEPGSTMASIIANEFTEATGAIHLSSLVALAFYLFVITAIMNAIGKWIIKKFSVETK